MNQQVQVGISPRGLAGSLTACSPQPAGRQCHQWTEPRKKTLKKLDGGLIQHVFKYLHESHIYIETCKDTNSTQHEVSVIIYKVGAWAAHLRAYMPSCCKNQDEQKQHHLLKFESTYTPQNKHRTWRWFLFVPCCFLVPSASIYIYICIMYTCECTLRSSSMVNSSITTSPWRLLHPPAAVSFCLLGLLQHGFQVSLGSKCWKAPEWPSVQG